MSQFYYFLQRAQRPADIPASLGYAFDGTPTMREAQRGPGGEPGITVSADSESIGYFPDKQDWLPHPTARCNDLPVYVGRDKTANPTPDSLKRQTLLDGQLTRLDDGNDWLVPLIRKWHTDDQESFFVPVLPAGVSHDPEALAEGKLTLSWADTANKYRPLEALAAEYAEFMSAETESSPFLDPQVLFESAVTVLSYNYRVSWVEMYMLGAFASTKTSQAVLNYSCMDLDNLSKWLEAKKKADTRPLASDGLNSTHGHEAEQETATSPPMQISSH